MSHGTAATRGHLASNGGLRGHSIDSIFPFIIFAQGTFDSMMWNVRHPNGVITEGGSTPQEAQGIAMHLLSVHELLAA